MFAGWSPIGIAALFAIVAGIALLVAYAVGRGLVDHELEGIEAPSIDATAEARAPSPASRRRSRTVGTVGATLLVVGLALGALAAVGTWSAGGPAAGGPGAPGDCAQSWNGCPKATP